MFLVGLLGVVIIRLVFLSASLVVMHSLTSFFLKLIQFWKHQWMKCFGSSQVLVPFTLSKQADETRTRCYHASFGSERVYIAERVVYF